MEAIRRRFDALSYIRANAAERPSSVAVYDLVRRVTFAELAQVVDGLVGRLRADGLAEGEPVRKYGQGSAGVPSKRRLPCRRGGDHAAAADAGRG